MTVSLVARARVLAAPTEGPLSVELLDAETCRGCRCGRLFDAHARTARLDLGPAPRLQAGEEIAIGLPARELLRAAVWVHGLPWLGLVMGSAAGAALGTGDRASLLGAVVGLAAALVVLRWTQRRRDQMAIAALRVTRASCKH